MIWILTVLILAFCNTLSFAQPSVSGVSGTVADQQSIIISGSGFGTKANAKPILWADFETNENPNSLGLITTWNAGTNQWNWVSATAHSGTHSAGNPDMTQGNGVVAQVETNAYASGYGTKFYISLWRHSTVTDLACNLKKFRAYKTGQTVPDFYIGKVQGQNEWMVNTEACGSQAYSSSPYNSWWSGSGVWQHEEYVFQYSSAPGANNGLFRIYSDGTQILAKTDWITTCSSDTGIETFIIIQNEKSNCTVSGGHEYFDNVYIDNTWQRVIVGNESTLASSTHREVQVPSSWSDSSIAVTVQRGSFGATDSAYLFVVDSSGNASPGYAITFGSGGGDTTGTTVSGVSMSGCSLH